MNQSLLHQIQSHIGRTWPIGSVVYSNGDTNSYPLEVFAEKNGRWATEIGYKRNASWLSLANDNRFSILYGRKMPGENNEEHNIRCSVRGTQSEWAAYVGLCISPETMENTERRSCTTEEHKDITLNILGRNIEIDVKSVPVIGLKDGAFLSEATRESSEWKEYRGTRGWHGKEGNLFVIAKQLRSPADIYMLVKYNCHPTDATRFSVELMGYGTKDMLKTAKRGAMNGAEILTEDLLPLDKCLEKYFLDHPLESK